MIRTYNFDREYILREFGRIDARLEREFQIYMIGGGAMALADIKEATKDVDIVIKDGEDAKHFVKVLEDLGYQRMLVPGKEYVEMGASFILENTEGFRWDVFVAQVMGGFIFSKDMEDRAEGIEGYNKLKIGIASKSDVFLFKSITDREGDLEDMSSLVRSGIDSEALLQEIETQRKLLDTEIWITHINEKLIKLDEKYGVTLPIEERIDGMARTVYDKLEVTMLLRKKDMRLKDLEETAKMGRKDLAKALDDLLSRRTVKKAGERFKLISDTL